MNNDQQHVLEILKNIPFFEDLTTEDLNQIKPLLCMFTIIAGEDIIREGEDGDSMFIIGSGTVSVSRTGEFGEKISLGNLRAGDCFGELTLIDNLPRSATVTAIEDSELFRLTRSDMDDFFSRNTRAASAMYRNTLIETFSRFRNALSNLSFSHHNLKEKNDILDEINRDLVSAQEIQEFFIGAETWKSRHSGCPEYSFIYRPSQAIGGDFINISAVNDGGTGILIADVEGHGITAALVTGVLKSSFAMLSKKCGNRPAELLSEMNNHLYDVINKVYATCYYAYIPSDRHCIIFAKAGHHHPLFWRAAEKSFCTITAKGPGLGIIPDATYTECTLPISPGDKILFYTDGIMEETDASMTMYGQNRLTGSFQACIEKNTNPVLPRILGDFRQFTKKDRYDDDITVLLLEF